MRRLAIYGKGGSGKSTIAANLSVFFAGRGLRTLQIGCDPKHDSTRALVAGRRGPTVIQILQQQGGEESVTRDDYLVAGLCGVGCIEAGGPEAGVGCAGLGISAAFRLIEKHKVLESFNIVLMDVLGDVVCGGFATPLMRGFSSSVVIVVAETRMSLYAANNIARAVARYSRHGSTLAGLVANGIARPERVTEITAFAKALGTRVLSVIPRDASFAEAERRGEPVSMVEPDGPMALALAHLGNALLGVDPAACPVPTPLADDHLDEFLRGLDR